MPATVLGLVGGEWLWVGVDQDGHPVEVDSPFGGPWPPDREALWAQAVALQLVLDRRPIKPCPR